LGGTPSHVVEGAEVCCSSPLEIFLLLPGAACPPVKKLCFRCYENLYSFYQNNSQTNGRIDEKIKLLVTVWISILSQVSELLTVGANHLAV